MALPVLEDLPEARTLDLPVDHRAQRERAHFNALTTAQNGSLVMPAGNISRYDRPPANTLYSLEYAFHLLDEIAGRRVLNVGCGEGLDAVILAALGAKVIGLDISDAAVAVTKARAYANGVTDRLTALVADATALPVSSGSIDVILAAAVMHHVDIRRAAAELARVLRPGGVAVFVEPLAGPPLVQLVKRMLPMRRAPDISEDERPLTRDDVALISSTIGSVEATRLFGLTTRLVGRVGRDRPLRAAYRLDRWVLGRSRALAALASPMVWSVRKPA
jgi:SAM-dependent methyltransferase